MIFDLVKDFADVRDAMPAEHPRRRFLKLLDEAIRRDMHFIDRHPTTFFQYMWNTCWWYECPEAEKHYVEPKGDWGEPHPWARGGTMLHELLQVWRRVREESGADYPWLRARRPPETHLGTTQLAVIRGHEREVSDVFTRRPAHRERFGRQVGAGVGGRERRGSRLPLRT